MIERPAGNATMWCQRCGTLFRLRDGMAAVAKFWLEHEKQCHATQQEPRATQQTGEA